MSSHRGHQEEKEIESVDSSLTKKLRSLNNMELYDLIENLMERDPGNRRFVLEWLKETGKCLGESDARKEKVSLNDELLWEYWENAKNIIAKFNEYGGGPDDEEEEACDWLNKISELIKDGSLSTGAKFDFLDDAFEEYNIGNSGFDDALMDVFFEICQRKEEWEYLVKKLDERPSDWRKKLIMDIQKNHLCDDKAYLEERMKILHYGLDYWDLVNFYIEKGDLQKAQDTAERGIFEGEGRLTELFQFLFEHFAKNRDTFNVERVVHTALSRKSEEKSMLDRLFEYYRSQGDYENAKKTLIKSYEFVRDGRYYAEYKRMKDFLRESDWKQLEPKIFNDCKEKNIKDYLRICLDKNMNKTVLDTILKPPRNRWGFIIENDFDEFADKLGEDFPEKIIEYYWQKTYNNISGGNRETYSTAARYLAKVKHIYTATLKEALKWEQRFSNLKAEFKNRPAFLEEVSEL